MTDLTLPPVPVPDAESEAWWASLADGTFAVARCAACRRWTQPPVERCRHCGGEMALEPVSGRGTIFSFIVVRHATVPGHVPPYVVALVQLEEQDDLHITGVVHADPDAVSVGAAVVARLSPIGDSGFVAPSFDLEV